MANKKSEGTVAEKAEAKEPKEKRYNDFSVRVFHGIEDFDVEGALSALADASQLHTKVTTAKSGRITITINTAESAKTAGQRGRPKKLVSKETEQAAIKLLRAAMRDPEKAPQITKLLAEAEGGKDVSDELSKLVGLNA